jgi:integrase
MTSTRRRTRGNGEGSLRQRPDGRWEARYHVDTPTGRERRSLLARTREEATQRLRDALHARDRTGVVSPRSRMTVGELLDAWLEALQVGPRTRLSYTQITRQHLIPALGDVQLTRLRPQQIEALYARLLATGRKPKVVRNVHGALHVALDKAVRWRLVSTNVADLVDPPRWERTEMQALNVEQARRVIAAARGDELEALWWLTLTTGLRQGELLALRWGAVDLDQRRLQVVATLVRIPGETPFLAQPKTRRSRRSVELCADAAEALRQHRQRSMASAVAAGAADAYVFTRADGRPLSVTTTWKRWRALLQRAEVPHVRFHDARHTAATLLLGLGIHPKIVSEMLGHATTAMTLDTYSHVTPTMQRDAAAAIGSLFAEAGSTP